MTLIEEYTKELKSTSGRSGYKSNIKSFFRYLEPDPEHEKKFNKHLGIPLSDKQKKFVDNYFKTNRNYKKDIKDFVKSLHGAPPKTIKSKAAAVKAFFEHYDIELKSKEWKEIRNEIKGSRAVTLDKIPSKEEMKQILSHATLKDKALFLTLISSGMRIGECCKIRLGDIKELPMINIRSAYTKSGNPRVTFVSPEAQEAIEQWLEQREDYLRVAVTRLNCQRPTIEGKRPERIKKSLDDDRVFPMATSTARTMWNRLIKKAGLAQRDPSSGYHSVHPHCLRKYFSSHLNIVGCPSDITEALLGHEEKLMRVYNLYTPDQLKDIYGKYLHGVCVFRDFDTEERISSISTELKVKDAEIQSMKKEMEGLIFRMGMMEKIEKMGQTINQMKTKQ